MKRTIIKIDESRCNGCGLCVKGCHEGALQLIDDKAVLISELYCDGLGACLGDCPHQAIQLEEREAEAYNEQQVMIRMLTKGEKVIAAHLRHLATHRQHDFLQQGIRVLEENNLPIPAFQVNAPTVPIDKVVADKSCPSTASEGGCPGNRSQSFAPQTHREPHSSPSHQQSYATATSPASELRQWPIQLHLVSPTAPWLKKANLLVAADCTAFTVGDFHSTWLRGKRLTIACPKLDNGREIYLEKLTTMIDEGGIDTMTVMIMEVPCCNGLLRLCQEARQKARRKIPLKLVKVSLQGEILE